MKVIQLKDQIVEYGNIYSKGIVNKVCEGLFLKLTGRIVERE